MGCEFASNLPLASYYDAADHDGGKPAGLAGRWAEESYHVVCADRGFEWLAHLNLTVREWNEQAVYEARGDPDATGSEPAGGPLDDFADWAVATPGSSTHVEGCE